MLISVVVQFQVIPHTWGANGEMSPTDTIATVHAMELDFGDDYLTEWWDSQEVKVRTVVRLRLWHHVT